MQTIRRTAAVAVTLAALAVPAAAQAGAGHDHGHVKSFVNDAIAKPLPPAKAKRLQERLERTGRYPKGPRIRSTRGLEKIETPALAKPAPAPGAEQILLNGKRPATGAKLFGYQGTYAEKRWALISWINYVYQQAIPSLGGGFRAPAVYEVQHGGYTPNGCGQIWNAGYCSTTNTVGFSSYYSQAAFANIGDAAFAGLMAHEYGHGAQAWLHINTGWMRYKQYSEGFADCMAGGWLAQMYNRGYVDGVGRGDWREYLDVLTHLAADVTNLNTHGRPDWRHALATYGWNYGMQGCVNWARSIV